MASKRLHIAFDDLSSQGGWMGGMHYLKNLFAAVRTLEEEVQPEMTLLTPSKANPETYHSLTPYLDQLLHHPPPPPKPGIWQQRLTRLKKRVGLWREPEPPLSLYLNNHQVDAIFVNSTSFGPHFKVPLLSWIPDFQHLHLPEMFSTTENQQRTENYARIATYATRVILSSEDARRDFQQFAPQAAGKSRALPFVAQIPADSYDTDPGWLCDHYHLPQRFVYLPNQFWSHKNHLVVLDALAQVVAKHPEIRVVCTGNTHDYRNLSYFDKFLTNVSKLGLRHHLIILGDRKSVV